MPPVLQVRGQQYQQLVEALNDAFPAIPSLTLMLKFRLDKNLPELASLPAPIDQVAFEVIQNANSQGWTAQLIAAARESRPGNPKLLKLARDFGLTAATPELERKVRDDLSYINITHWRERLGAIEAQVCRVETRSSMGTGFLVGPDLLITNYHVMKDVIANPASASSVVLRFDYKQLSSGGVVNPGTEYRLASKNWLVDSSPYSQVDLLADPGDQTPSSDELDYALLRLDSEAGDELVAGAKADKDTPKRDWLRPLTTYAFPLNGPILIVQHPEGKPLKLALDTKSILGCNSNNTRVRYVTNTERGSSGSPVFNENWDLVALHHSGDRSIVPVFNVAIPFAAITALLAQRGHALES
jgi:V8-like Glu-specific endopeptidase